MHESRKEFASLIRATLDFLQEGWPEPVRLSLKEKEPPPPKPISPPPTAAPATAPVEAKKPETKPEAKWKLTPFPLPSENLPHFAQFYSSQPLHIPIRLLVVNETQTLFLENVARALTQYMAPAALFSGKIDTLLTNQNIQLVLAPLSLLQKRFSQVDLHQFHKLDGPTLLPLADHYDTDLKRTLWNTLKSFPTMPQSS
ncbi:MAG: hypothetical protein S4CHLAM2_10920 [Chlamydiales bacterium]|nr:hypothetical protein [Chlamydiales bacterium]